MEQVPNRSDPLGELPTEALSTTSHLPDGYMIRGLSKERYLLINGLAYLNLAQYENDLLEHPPKKSYSSEYTTFYIEPLTFDPCHINLFAISRILF